MKIPDTDADHKDYAQNHNDGIHKLPPFLCNLYTVCFVQVVLLKFPVRVSYREIPENGIESEQS